MKMKLPKRIKWNIDVFPVLTHFVVAHVNKEIKLFKTDGVMSVGMTKRIVKALEKGWA